MPLLIAALGGSALAAPPPPPLGFQPNILLLFPDEWRFDWDGFREDNGAVPLAVPNLRAFAAKGTRFQHAYVPAPVCAPSRSCLASGREFDLAHVPTNFGHGDYPWWQTTFYTQLQRAGYHTMMAGKDDLTKDTQLGSTIGAYLPHGRYGMAEIGISDGVRYSGKADVIDKYPEPHESYGYFLRNQTVRLENGTAISGWEAHHACFRGDWALCDSSSYPDELYEDNWTGANAVALLERKPPGKPWFLHVSFPGPHPVFLTTGEMAASVANRTWPNPVDATAGGGVATCDTNTGARGGEPGLGKQNDGSRCNYGAEIENLDRLFGLVLAKVEALGEADTTLVCVSSDHGDMMGDHDGWAKSKPWEASASVPLLCFGPGVQAGKVVDEPAATLDLAATFIDYAGAELGANMTSTSLRPILQGSATTVRPFVSSGLDNWRLAVQQHNGTWYKFVCCQGACPQAPHNVPAPVGGWTQLLYQVGAGGDQFDMHDLSAELPGVVAAMRPLLPEVFGCGAAPPLLR
jgi:arylsulfatase A-like enzyme